MAESNRSISEIESNVYEMEENTYKSLLDEISRCEAEGTDQQQCFRKIAERMGGSSLSRRFFGVLFPTVEGDTQGR